MLFQHSKEKSYYWYGDWKLSKSMLEAVVKMICTYTYSLKVIQQDWLRMENRLKTEEVTSQKIVGDMRVEVYVRLG